MHAVAAAITARTGIRASTCVLTMVDVLARAGLRRIGLVTPYTSDVQARIGEDHCFVRKVSARHPDLLEQLRQAVLPKAVAAEPQREAGAA